MSRRTTTRRRTIAGGALVGLIVGLAVIAALLSISQLLPSLPQGLAGTATPGEETPGEEASPPGRRAGGPTGGRAPTSERARVVRHVDGDTLILRAAHGRTELLPSRQTRVRLLEIDTPESVTPGQPVECYGTQASALLEELTPVGSVVRVRPDRDLLDPYGRTLLYVWNKDGAFVNLELVRSGAARAVLYEPNDRYIHRMRRAEGDAQAAGRGQWGAC